MATTSKAQFLTEVQALLKNRYKLEPGPEKLPILEAVVYGICHEDSSRKLALKALSLFKDNFFDWNEVRVSSLEEIQNVLKELDQADVRAFRVRRFLRQLFEKTYGFSLDTLLKKPQKESMKALEEYEAIGSDYVVATITRLALAGHAIPIDSGALRALTRLGVADGEASDVVALRGVLERAVPKNRGAEFADLIEELALDTCVEGVPECARCELNKICPTGIDQAAHGGVPKVGKVKSSRSKTSE